MACGLWLKKNLSTGETVVHSGRDDDLDRQGVVIMVSGKASLINWTSVNESFISARFYSKHIKPIIIHVYAPTYDADENENTCFYEMLGDIVDNVHRHDRFIITGDMTAKVENKSENYDDIMDRHSAGTRNENGGRLCDFCAMNRQFSRTWKYISYPGSQQMVAPETK